MQETRNNYFGLKISSTNFRQAKTGKHDCRNITATVRKTSIFKTTFEKENPIKEKIIKEQ